MSHALRVFLTFLVGCFFFVALPLIGWGVMNIGSFLASPGRAAFMVLVCILNGFAAVRIPEVGKKSANLKKSVGRQHVAVLFFQTFSLALVLVGPFCDRREIATIVAGEGVRFVGLGLYVAGFLLMHFAEWYLGKHFTVEVGIQEAQALVTNGPYRYLMHPRYLGIELFSVGIALVFRSWIGIALAAATLGVILWRIHDEETLMHDEFGKRWEEFTKKRWRLVPLVY
jgi:protein-S-isoprenylcysteine O-methyltransferase Ste14